LGLEPGTTVDHYVVRQFIDAGGMGEVYVAFDPRLERQVAIKVLPEGLARDPELQRRFRRETQAISTQSLLRSGPMDIDHLLHIGIQVASALDDAHREGIVHRDIKSGNVFVNTRGDAKVLDFGIAKLVEADLRPALETGSRIPATWPSTSSRKARNSLMRIPRIVASLFLLCFLTASAASAQTQADVEAVNRLLDRYAALEETMDMATQAQLIREDRVWIAQGQGRRTDQAKNMHIQSVSFDVLRETVPGLRWFVEDRDRMVRFHGGGTVAIASFYRYSAYVIPAGTPPEIAEGLAALPASAVTVVLEKTGGEWKIVHTHFSDLGPPAGE